MGRLPASFRLSIGAAILATVAATVLRIAVPFDHGIWLVAYLLLVGSLAQYMLAIGRSLLVPLASPRPAGTEALLWSIGVLLVPVGVLGGTRLLVAAGSIALIAALFLLWQETRSAIADRTHRMALPCLGLIVFMTLSVFAGMALASDVPWT